MRFTSLVVLSFTLFLFACGGNRVASSGSVSDDTLEANAVSTSPWSAEPVVAATTSQKTSANINIQDLLTTVVAEDEDSSKKSKTRTVTINKVITGSKGGTATISGTRIITTTPHSIFPVTIETEGTISFDGYEGNEFSLHGTSEYSGTKTITGTLPIRTTDPILVTNTESTSDTAAEVSTTTLTTAQKTTDISNIQTLISSVISENEASSKKERTRTVTINRDVVGPRGGSATVTGSRVVTTTTGEIYPITTTTEANINFDNYIGNHFAVAGETQYTGSTTITSG